MSKFLSDRCEVCGERVIDTRRLPQEIRDKVYKPAEGESYFVEEEMAPTQSFRGRNGDEPIEVDFDVD
jgi:hypothetical protein